MSRNDEMFFWNQKRQAKREDGERDKHGTGWVDE